MKHHSGYFTLEPSILEARFDADQGMDSLGSIFTDPSEDDNVKLEAISRLMPLLPPRERDFLDLYFFRHCKQTDIASIFRVSQPTVCYRLRRATSRILFLMSFPELDREVTQTRLSAVLTDPLDVEIMLLIYETTCQLETARRLSVSRGVKTSQGLVRHRFIRSIKKITKEPELADLALMYSNISGNLNILREVKKFPQEDDPEIVYLLD